MNLPPHYRRCIIAYLGEEFFNSRVLMHEGVSFAGNPGARAAIDNTADEVRTIAAELEQEKGAAVISSPRRHTRGRANAVERACGWEGESHCTRRFH